MSLLFYFSSFPSSPTSQCFLIFILLLLKKNLFFLNVLNYPIFPTYYICSTFALIGFKAICIPLVDEVFMFTILQSLHDVALIFRTCQLHTAWKLLHENGGNERQAGHGAGGGGHSEAIQGLGCHTFFR